MTNEIFANKEESSLKKYEYVNIKIATFWKAGSDEHRGIIDEYAKRGFRYVGYIPTKIEAYGRVTEIDLIFEIDLD